jgi:hypothetical protein
VADLMTTASRNVLVKLDKVDAQVVDFFVPAAERLLSTGTPINRVLAAALASLSGFRHVPQPRSLMTYEEGMDTLKLMGRPGEERRGERRGVLLLHLALLLLHLPPLLLHPPLLLLLLAVLCLNLFCPLFLSFSLSVNFGGGIGTNIGRCSYYEPPMGFRV